METCFAQSEGLLDVPRLRRMWSRFRALPRRGGDVMSHGDLIPGNVLVAGDRLGGVLDTGGFGPADPALDLVSAWHLLRPGPRDVLRRALHCDDLEWERGKLQWFIDGVRVKTSTRSVPEVGMYLILNTSVGGDWPGMPNATSVFPQQFGVDYVRVYQRPGASPLAAR